MAFEPTRKRREVSPRTISALRLVGWRFSFSRAAWVHRFRKGRYGPVFVVRETGARPTDRAETRFAVMAHAEDAVAAAEAAVSAAAAATREPEPAPPLPRRTPGATTAPTRPHGPVGETSHRRTDDEPPNQTSTVDDHPAPAPAPAPEPTPQEEPSPAWKVDGRPTFPRPRSDVNRRPGAPTTKRASA